MRLADFAPRVKTMPQPSGYLETEMSRDHVSHREIAQFAENRVNLPKAKANEYRAQARRLREKLETYLDEHPDFTLRKRVFRV